VTDVLARRDERGAAVPVAIGLVGVLLVITMVCVGTVALVLTHRRVQVAADLASLAAAAAIQRGVDPCSAATGIARRHRADLVACVVSGPDVVVATAVRAPAVLGGAVLSARSRAGPARPPG
jgi:secretion/DNA translocation related TadE-like protein